MDADGNQAPVPPLHAETCEEQRRYAEAQQRRAAQLARVGRGKKTECQ